MNVPFKTMTRSKAMLISLSVLFVCIVAICVFVQDYFVSGRAEQYKIRNLHSLKLKIYLDVINFRKFVQKNAD